MYLVGREASMQPNSADVPLCVDLDGTLVATDTLHESLLIAVKRKPSFLFRLPFWLARGKAGFKRRLTAEAALDCALLPYRPDLLEWLREQKSAGRRLYLVTASDQSVADAVASHLSPLFDEAWGSDGSRNLSGSLKQRYLVERFGEKGFDYAGNAAIDMAVWSSARKPIVAGASPALQAEVERRFPDAKVFPAPPFRFKTVVRAIRVQQWVKNVLVFTVLVTSHRLLDTSLWLPALLAFLALSFCASSIYIINDLLDLESDRKHPKKRKRPFASGALPVAAGVAIIPLFLAGALVLSIWLPPAARLVLAVYPIVSIAYCFYLKRKTLVDVFTLSALYTSRVLLGAAATGVLCSQWLMGFSSFLFLSLAFSKRASELIGLQQRHATAVSGRAYFVWDLAAVQSSGIASCFTAGIVLTLYIQSREVHQLYREPQWLWVVVIGIIFWLLHVWLVASRGQLDEDPVLFAVRDPVSYLLFATFAAAVVLARTGWLAMPGIQ
jgi:4-hydroxybenzoate polyprenyltransferase/phosphoserine phosphatase